MKLKLIRLDHQADGITGVLVDEHYNQLAVTLEHAYDSGLGNGSFAAKTPPGRYTCKRGIHRLHNLVDFVTFELLKVPNAKGILFHQGNFNEDSDGCILLGKIKTTSSDKKTMVTSSRDTFKKFMDFTAGVDNFELTIVDKSSKLS